MSLGGIATPESPVSVNVGGESRKLVRTFGFFPATAAEETHADEKTFLFDVGASMGPLGAGEPLQVHLESVPLREAVQAVGPGVTPSTVKIEVIEHS